MFTTLIYSEAAAPGKGTSGCLKMVAHLIEVLFSVVLTVMSAGSIGSLASKLMESGCLGVLKSRRNCATLLIEFSKCVLKSGAA